MRNSLLLKTKEEGKPQDFFQSNKRGEPGTLKDNLQSNHACTLNIEESSKLGVNFFPKAPVSLTSAQVNTDYKSNSTAQFIKEHKIESSTKNNNVSFSFMDNSSKSKEDKVPKTSEEIVELHRQSRKSLEEPNKNNGIMERDSSEVRDSHYQIGEEEGGNGVMVPESCDT